MSLPGGSRGLFGGAPARPPFGPIPTPTVAPSINTGASNAPVATGTTTSSTQPKSSVAVTRAVSTPGKKPSSKSYKETVVLVVGATKECYTLHKDLLCFYSDFFRAAFNGSFKEATERKIELLEVETHVFEAFQVWLYTQDLPLIDNVSKDTYPDWSLLIKLWIFGDKYQIPLLQNNTMDKIVDKLDKDRNNPLLWITHVYENTTVNSVLRKAVVDAMSYRSRMPDGKNYHKIEETCLKDPDDWPKQACLDVMAEMSRGWANQAKRFAFPM